MTIIQFYDPNAPKYGDEQMRQQWIERFEKEGDGRQAHLLQEVCSDPATGKVSAWYDPFRGNWRLTNEVCLSTLKS